MSWIQFYHQPWDQPGWNLSTDSAMERINAKVTQFLGVMASWGTGKEPCMGPSFSMWNECSESYKTMVMEFIQDSKFGQYLHVIGSGCGSQLLVVIADEDKASACEVAKSLIDVESYQDLLCRISADQDLHWQIFHLEEKRAKQVIEEVGHVY